MDKLYTCRDNDMRFHKPYNCQSHLSFLNIDHNYLQPHIWRELEAGMWRDLDVNAFLYNSHLLPSRKNNQMPLFPNFKQIEPGIKLVDNKFELDLYRPKPVNPSYEFFLESAEKFFYSLNAKRIGVHLSGGLDSSIIICLLKELDIPFVPIGLVSETFEFRTERKIQEKLLEYGENGMLISMEEHPFYSDLKRIPKHQIPAGFFKSYAGNLAMARAFSKLGCDVVLTGQGGDTLFVDGIPSLEHIGFNIADEFHNCDEADLIYHPHGIKLISFYSDQCVIDMITSARLNQPDDVLKKWARDRFKSILIPELYNYTYCADFIGMTMWGLETAHPVIRELMEEAYDHTHNEIFSDSNVKKFQSKDIFSFEHYDYINFCSLIAVAVWYHSILSNDNE